ncbi:isochorismatase family protein [Pseudomonas aeruginosa]|uniref:isochorismatase family protein n=1 Tax=Pseudomonas aeruginosa TaxID=287 RepID=UPI003759F18C
MAPVEGEAVIIKHENCASIETRLDAILKSMHVKRIVLTGVVIHNSMDATIRAGKALGYEIILPADATTAVPVIRPNGTFWDASTVYELTLAILGTEYAQVMSSEDVVAQLCL